MHGFQCPMHICAARGIKHCEPRVEEGRDWKRDIRAPHQGEEELESWDEASSLSSAKFCLSGHGLRYLPARSFDGWVSFCLTQNPFWQKTTEKFNLCVLIFLDTFGWCIWDTTALGLASWCGYLNHAQSIVFVPPPGLQCFLISLKIAFCTLWTTF